MQCKGLGFQGEVCSRVEEKGDCSEKRPETAYVEANSFCFAAELLKMFSISRRIQPEEEAPDDCLQVIWEIPGKIRKEKLNGI